MFTKTQQQEILSAIKDGSLSYNPIPEVIRQIPFDLTLAGQIEFMCYEPEAIHHAIEHTRALVYEITFNHFHFLCKEWHKINNMFVNYQFRSDMRKALGIKPEAILINERKEREDHKGEKEGEIELRQNRPIGIRAMEDISFLRSLGKKDPVCRFFGDPKLFDSFKEKLIRQLKSGTFEYPREFRTDMSTRPRKAHTLLRQRSMLRYCITARGLQIKMMFNNPDIMRRYNEIFLNVQSSDGKEAMEQYLLPPQNPTLIEKILSSL